MRSSRGLYYVYGVCLQLVNHPIVGQEITEEDEKILEYLKALDVTFTDDNGSFKIHLVRMLSSY